MQRQQRSPAFLDILGMATTAVVLAAVIAIGIDVRTDYAGHFLAGAGATAILLALVTAFAPGPRPGLALGLCLVAIALGVGTENTIFQDSAFDWVDLAFQSSGAALATLPFVPGGGGPRNDYAFGAGFALLIGGFFLAFGA